MIIVAQKKQHPSCNNDNDNVSTPACCERWRGTRRAASRITGDGDGKRARIGMEDSDLAGRTEQNQTACG